MTWTTPRLRAAVSAAAFATVLLLASAIVDHHVAASTTLTRNPYVNLVTPVSATIAWHQDTATTGTVVYSTDLSYALSATDAATDTIHAVTVTGLTPGSIYFYRVVAAPGDTLTPPSDFFQTAPTPNPADQFSFAALGDLGAATTDQMDVAGLVGGGAVQLAIVPGDVVYDAGAPQEFDPNFFQIYQSSLAIVPFYTALGERDVATSNGQPYLDNFYLPKNSSTNTERYYSFDYGNAHFVSLEVTQENTTPDATMLTWLDQDLAATAQRWKIVFFHVPMYSNSGAHGGDPTIAAALEPIFLNRGVDLVVQGHNRFYSRTYPIVNGAPVNTADEPHYFNPSGPIYVTTGGGGAPLDPVNAKGPLEAAAVSDHHLLYGFVAGSAMSFVAFSSTSAVLDSFSIVKNPTTAIAFTGFEATGEADGVRLRWRRTDGGSDGGFNVYRAPDMAGPWSKLNPDLLRGSSTFDYLDRDGAVGVTYAYRLGMVDGQGNETNTALASASRLGPLRFALERPRPNPARGDAVIPFSLERPAPTSVFIVDVSGRLVRNLASRTLPAGPQSLTWDGRDGNGRAVASGIYFAVVRSGGNEARTRVALLR